MLEIRTKYDIYLGLDVLCELRPISYSYHETGMTLLRSGDTIIFSPMNPMGINAQ